MYNLSIDGKELRFKQEELRDGFFKLDIVAKIMGYRFLENAYPWDESNIVRFGIVEGEGERYSIAFRSWGEVVDDIMFEYNVTYTEEQVKAANVDRCLEKINEIVDLL